MCGDEQQVRHLGVEAIVDARTRDVTSYERLSYAACGARDSEFGRNSRDNSGPQKNASSGERLQLHSRQKSRASYRNASQTAVAAAAADGVAGATRFSAAAAPGLLSRGHRQGE